MKKVILNKTSHVLNGHQNASHGIHHPRKKVEPEIKELFKVLLTLPDKAVVARVIAAINGDNSQCSCKTKMAKRDVSTQTDDDDTKTIKELKIGANVPHNDQKPSEVDAKSNGGDSVKNDSANETTTKNCEQEAPKRRRRKRKVCLPQAQHVSQVQILRRLQPKSAQITSAAKKTVSNKPEQSYSVFDHGVTPFKRSRSDSMFSLGETLDAILGEISNVEKPSPETVNKMMAEEFCTAENSIDGLLPIHMAIMNKDKNKLNRQLFIWKYNKVNINELLTDENQDCLQLAIVCNSSKDIINILLDTELDVNCVDDHSNTIIHLAIINGIDLSCLELLMERMDLQILLKLNDNGLSPLHLAVRHDRYLHAEVLLNAIDKHTLGKTIYDRHIDKLDKSLVMVDASASSEQQKNFHKFYEDACDCLEMLHAPDVRESMLKNSIKMKLLHLGESCSGNTALLNALEDSMEHFIYFLLAHLCDPHCANHSGQDAKSYFTEFSKSLTLSLKIDRTMEKVIAITNDVFLVQ